MSRPIFSPAAAVTVDVLIAPPRQAQHTRRCELEPGLRSIEGRVFYSAAWLDRRPALSEPPTFTRAQHDGRE